MENFDNELFANLKRNDCSAFDAIYSNYSKPLYIYLLQKLKDHDLCNDLLQDIFVNLWEKRAIIVIDTSLKAYLYQVARYKIIDVYRNDIRYQKYLSNLTDYVTDHSQIIERIDQRKKLRDIETAITKLPERMREIFILSRFEHRTTRDIASKTNLSPQTVKNQISKALRILRASYISADIVFIFISLFFF